MQEIKKDGIIYAIFIETKNLENGVKWYTGPEETLQVCTRKYRGAKVKHLQHHYHEKIVREIIETQECYILIEGRLSAKLYDNKKRMFRELDMREGDILILLRGGHGFTIHSDRCTIYEIKAAKFVKDIVYLP